ncbi:hypothetical protein DHW03_16640 [Pedobacter yonginense]|uniref:Methyltransferase FkbM domain-containing protein n=1 Tax=Pedobacter yonginense TaxID=651869 RepID=A0A317EMY9_9SPHI|nr:FkbM family methyltransferase [Pedobacter yonginense]PWS26408.1 hypothetical protein DHW03_16640 [Pedobacter yonginense]
MIEKLLKNILKSIGIQISRTDRTDPNQITERNIGGFNMKMNHSHIHNSKFLYQNYDQNLSRLVEIVKQKFPDLSVVDVGANIGDGVAIIKQLNDVPIVCIEGDDKYFKLLDENVKQFDKIQLFKAFLGEKNEVIHGALNHDSGTLKIDVSRQNEKITIQTLDSLVDQNPNTFARSKVLKIDTDGFDFKVLKGAARFINQQTPIIFFEYSEHHLREVGENGLLLFDLLKELGYEYLALYDHTGRFMLSLNVNNANTIEQIHYYISNYNATIPYFDIAAFSASDIDVFEQVIAGEIKINIAGPNRLIYNI